MRYWVNTVSRSHVQKGVEGGFTQADHGKDTRLKRITKGDRIVFYSPRTDYPDGAPLQRFTALGTVSDDAPFQVVMTPEFHPWRRRVVFQQATEAEVRPLIANLTFITNKTSWGITFRRGFFEIPAADFERIANAMGAE